MGGMCICICVHECRYVCVCTFLCVCVYMSTGACGLRGSDLPEDRAVGSCELLSGGAVTGTPVFPRVVHALGC